MVSIPFLKVKVEEGHPLQAPLQDDLYHLFFGIIGIKDNVPAVAGNGRFDIFLEDIDDLFGGAFGINGHRDLLAPQKR